MLWGTLVDRLLYKANISHAELARDLNCDRSYVHSIMRSKKKPPSLTKLNKIYNLISQKIELEHNTKIDFYNLAMAEKYENALALFNYCKSLKI